MRDKWPFSVKFGNGKFSKIWKKFLKKIVKMHYFSKFFKRFNKPCFTFSRVWTKNTNCWETLGNFLIFSKDFFRKFRKIHYFSIVFEKFNKPYVNSSRVWTKNTNCWEILRKHWKVWWKFNRKIECLCIFGKRCC